MAVRGGTAAARMRKRAALLEARVNAALEQAAQIALSTAKGKAPGRISSTIKAYATRGFVSGVRVYSTWPLAKFVENDTAPHVIEPRDAKILHFMANGREVFARRVNHPGTRGQHFFRAGREAGREALKRLIEEAIAGV